MERKESENGLQLIKFGAIRLKGKFSQLFMGAFNMVLPLSLVVLVPLIVSIILNNYISLCISLFFFVLLIGPLQVGYIKFFNETLQGEQPKLSRVYSEFKFNNSMFKIIGISSLLLFMYFVGGMLWIVPAFVVIAFFSMILFFYEKYDKSSVKDLFKQCAIYMNGNKTSLFLYKSIFYVLYLVLFFILALLLLLIYKVAMDSLVIAWVISICSVIIFIFLYSLITLYFHSCNQIFFEDVLMHRNIVKEKQKSTKKSTNKLSDKTKSKKYSKSKINKIGDKKTKKNNSKKDDLNSKKDDLNSKKESLNKDKYIDIKNEKSDKTN